MRVEHILGGWTNTGTGKAWPKGTNMGVKEGPGPFPAVGEKVLKAPFGTYDEKRETGRSKPFTQENARDKLGGRETYPLCCK